ncbi:hypothetical protein H4R24_000809 [Coemansia sp. RSA 988]|nr:hypothetical protein H4R24_000809 [Coemansia sp. RSA 988]
MEDSAPDQRTRRPSMSERQHESHPSPLRSWTAAAALPVTPQDSLSTIHSQRTTLNSQETLPPSPRPHQGPDLLNRSGTSPAPPLPASSHVTHVSRPPLPTSPRPTRDIPPPLPTSPRPTHVTTPPALPTTRRPALSTTPPQQASRAFSHHAPTEGSFETSDDDTLALHPTSHAKFSLDAARPTATETQHTPQPVHRSGFHRSVNSLPTNMPLISAPPASESPLAMPSAPPITDRVPTFISVGHPRNSSHENLHADSASTTSASSSVVSLQSSPPATEYPFASRTVTPSVDVCNVAMHTASANMDSKMLSDRVLNFRDLGVSVLKASLRKGHSIGAGDHAGPMPGVVFRSAEVGSAGEHDVKTLFSKYGIRTIIDLRSELEARASDILTTHYPAGMQPTAGQSFDKLSNLRATQLRNTIVEVAAHDYEAAARPWERTGETQSSWSRRNSLRYTKSLGDPRKDPLASALAHLYDPATDQDTLETQNVTVDKPYVPRSCDPPPMPPSSTAHVLSSRPETPDNRPNPHPDRVADPPSSNADVREPGFAQSALDWSNETLQMLRSYWEKHPPPSTSQLGPTLNSTTRQRSEPPAAHLPPIPEFQSPTASTATTVQSEEKKDQAQLPAVAKLPRLPSRNPEQATAVRHSTDSDADGYHTDSTGSTDSTDSFYHNSVDDANREPTRYGLRPVGANENATDLVTPRIVVDAPNADDLGSKSLSNIQRVHTEPSLTRLNEKSAQSPHSQHQRSMTSGSSGDHTANLVATQDSALLNSACIKLRIANKFGGKRTRYRCNVIGENYRKRCVWAHAPLSTKIKVVLRFATFNKAEAIRTIGREVLAPRGLAGSYEDYVDYCKEEFAAVLRIFADPCAYPILFHCQHGKDRTGIVAMLLMGILDVDDYVIAEDYAQSEKNLAPVRKRMEMLDMGAVGLPPSFCDSPAPVMLSLLHHIRSNYGSIRGYLRSAGLTHKEINTIAWCLRGNFYAIAHPVPRRPSEGTQRSVYLRPSVAHSEFFGSTPTAASANTDAPTTTDRPQSLYRTDH